MTAVDRTLEPLYRLPARGLALGWVIVAVVCATIWPLVGPGLQSAFGWDDNPVAGGALGSGAALFAGAAALLVIQPWKPRLAGDLPTVWLAFIVVRLFATPALALMLYFAARPPTGPFALGVALAYLGLLLLETLLAASSIRGKLAQTTSTEAVPRVQDTDDAFG